MSCRALQSYTRGRNQAGTFARSIAAPGRGEGGSAAQHFPYPLGGIPDGPPGPDGGVYRLLGGSTRERERERDASATLTRPITDPSRAQRPSTALIPKECTRNTTLSLVATRSLSQGPRQNCVGVDHEDRPLPDLMCAATERCQLS